MCLGEAMLYQLYELNHAAVAPLRTIGQWQHFWWTHPWNPWTYTYPVRALSAGWQLFERATRQYGKPEFGLNEVLVSGRRVPVTTTVVKSLDFGDLLHFRRDPARLPTQHRDDPVTLIVAPMSGHYATLLRGTVRAMLQNHDVYITDWRDAREVPLTAGGFDLDSYIDYLLAFLRHLGPRTNVLAVCQPGPAVLAASSLLAAEDDPCQPASVVLMGSPIDTRRSPTQPNILATTKPIEWFEQNVILRVPWPNPGWGRRVYPGFLQLTGFMTMNLDRHLNAHQKLFQDLIVGDGDSVTAHKKFYDEYLAVMDLTAEYYLQTIRVVFQEHDLPEGRMRHGGRLVRPAAMRKTALMTVEGERDDISGIGQTQAAHDLCVNIPSAWRTDHVQAGVGHYGVFNGAKWRTEIYPRVRDFIHSHARR